MSISRQALLYVVDYSVWADQQLLSACSALSTEKLRRDMGISHAGIAGTLRHIYDAERIWPERLRDNKLPPLVEIEGRCPFQHPPPDPGLRALQQDWPSVWAGLRHYVETVPEAELAGEIRGIDCSIPRWKLLLHVVNHATLHRGQVMGMLRQLGRQPPATDI
jgi:uncharacterized damage-inducible protein DinB